MRLTADNQYRWQDTLLEAVRIGGVLAGLVLLSACSMSGTSQASQSARPVSPAPTRCRRPGETMDLTGSAFFHSGYYTSFSVLSDYPCHVRYVESIAVPLDRTQVDVYAIDPAPGSRWVVVQQREGERSRLMFYVRKGKAFPRQPLGRIPVRLRREILQQVLPLMRANAGTV